MADAVIDRLTDSQYEHFTAARLHLDADVLDLLATIERRKQMGGLVRAPRDVE